MMSKHGSGCPQMQYLMQLCYLSFSLMVDASQGDLEDFEIVHICMIQICCDFFVKFSWNNLCNKM